MNKKLSRSFYLSNDILQLSKSLLGKSLCTNISNKFTSGKIVEVEAYLGIQDRASHSYNNRRTPRTETMFKLGGISYVYLCYGIHYLFNVVVSKKEVPCAILIRSIEPLEGINIMLERRKFSLINKELTNGPGKLSKALGITLKHNSISLDSNIIWIENNRFIIKEKDILSSPRIGVDYAGRDANLPYRFSIKANKWVSKSS